MADQDKDINYENPSEGQASPVNSLNEQIQRLFQNRLVVVGLAFLVMFYIYSSFFSSSKPAKKAAEMKPVAQKQAVVVKVPSFAKVTPKVVKKPALSESDIHSIIHGDTKHLNKQFDTLINQVNAVHQKLNLMDNQFKQVSTEMNNLPLRQKQPWQSMQR